MDIGKLQYLNIRDIWRTEPAGFTRWLVGNIEHINGLLEMSLNSVETEKQIGSFNVDIYCEDEHSNPVIIENQLEKTDHTHLGQVMTYAVGIDAKTVIWISPDPRLEHVKTMEWLNEVTPVDMQWYLIKLEAVKIGESPAAPLFSIVAGPSPERKAIGDMKKRLAERQLMSYEFWEGLLPVLSDKTKLFSGCSPSKDPWLNTGTEIGGIYFGLNIAMDKVNLVLQMTKDKEKNKEVFDFLFERKEKIEKAFGQKMNWLRMDDKIISKIEYLIPDCNVENVKTWESIYKAIADTLIKWDKAFETPLRELRTKGIV